MYRLLAAYDNRAKILKMFLSGALVFFDAFTSLVSSRLLKNSSVPQFEQNLCVDSSSLEHLGHFLGSIILFSWHDAAYG